MIQGATMTQVVQAGFMGSHNSASIGSSKEDEIGKELRVIINLARSCHSDCSPPCHSIVQQNHT